MNAIVGLGMILGRTSLDLEQKKYLSDIRASSDALLMIINDILDFSKIEAGKMELVSVNYNLTTLLDGLYSIFLFLCKEKGLSLRFDAAENLPSMLYGDENRVRQVLTNLLSNAVKYTAKGGVTFSIWLEGPDTLRADIVDTGIGISKEAMDKLFQPFERLDIHKNRNISGTGLGLAICYDLCKIMDGELWVASILGEGSTFSIRLPYIPVKDLAPTEVEQVMADFTAPAARILVVDDIDINLTVAEALLGTFGIRPDLAQSGIGALELIANNRYDIIFMDHMMPEMDGIEATRRIRELEGWNREVPIVALTANVVSGIEQIYLNNFMNDYLSKPIDVTSLNLCLRRWLPKELLVE